MEGSVLFNDLVANCPDYLYERAFPVGELNTSTQEVAVSSCKVLSQLHESDFTWNIIQSN
jgi:hypothetical protein